MHNTHGGRKRKLLNRTVRGRNLREFLKKGGGEIIVFLINLPVLIAILFLVLDIIHVGTIKERLEYTAYKAARAAVVCKDIKEANEVAKKVAIEDLEKSGIKATWNKNDVAKVILADGSGIDSLGKNGIQKSSKADNSKWEKGNFIQCTVTVDVKTYDRFSSGKRTGIITMMIEEYDQEEGEYPWFRNM